MRNLWIKDNFFILIEIIYKDSITLIKNAFRYQGVLYSSTIIMDYTRVNKTWLSYLSPSSCYCTKKWVLYKIKLKVNIKKLKVCKTSCDSM